MILKNASIRPAVHLSQNTRKCARNGAFCTTFFAFCSISRQGWHLCKKSKDFVVYFFAALIKHEIRMKCEKCIMSVMYSVVCFAKNTRKMRKVYSQLSIQTRIQYIDKSIQKVLGFKLLLHAFLFPLLPSKAQIEYEYWLFPPLFSPFWSSFDMSEIKAYFKLIFLVLLMLDRINNFSLHWKSELLIWHFVQQIQLSMLVFTITYGREGQVDESYKLTNCSFHKKISIVSPNYAW